MKAKLIALLAALTLIPAMGQAQGIELNEPRGYAALSLGLGLLETDDSSFGYGADLGIEFANNVAGNVFFLASGNQSDESEAELSHYGIGSDYNFSGGMLENLRIGARLGAVTENLNSETETGIAFGPHIAYHYPLTREFSIGADGLVMFNSTVESGSTTYLQATGRYWF